MSKVTTQYMSKVTNNVLGTINVKSYKQCIRSNKCQ